MIFLSSIPRSGSTLLTSLLNQRLDVYASPTSNLCDTMGAIVLSWERNPTTQASNGKQEDLIRILNSTMMSRYNTPNMVFDKGRGWAAPRIIQTLSKFTDVKIVATVRPIADCLASLVRIAKPTNVAMFCKHNELAKHLFNAYATLKAGYMAYPEKFLLIEYDHLVTQPQIQLDRIAKFVGLPLYQHDIQNVPNSEEIDTAWGILDLHKVRGKVAKQEYSVRETLGDKLYEVYQGGDFWNDKPDPIRIKQPITLQHELLMAGKLEESKEMCYRLHEEHPEDNDIAFNTGWFKLSDGKIKEGYTLLDRGRSESTWGDPHIGSAQPIWNGERNSTVLLRLERGLGDQIHQVRYAQEIAALGNVVIVSCSPELAHVMRHAQGVSVVVEHQAALGVLHDYWFPAMSFPSLTGHISGDPYISTPQVTIVPGRIGLRWQGNPLYEHSTKRLFPTDPFFKFVRSKGDNFISLQRDEGSEHKPDWVEQVDLSTWVHTAKAIASCELVITSCTAVAHLSGAMGIPTRIIVPHVPYYLWAQPGAKTPYYDSVTLCRQEKPDSWVEAFKNAA